MDHSAPVSPPEIYPIVCLRCLYPLEAGVGAQSGASIMGLRHPATVAAPHPCDPGYAMACAFCASDGPMWFIAYAADPAAPLASGAVNVCESCRRALATGDVDTVVHRALATLPDDTTPERRVLNEGRVREQLMWLHTHRRGRARLAKDLVPTAVFASPAARSHPSLP